MNAVDLGWRFRRLSKMSASEMGWRISDHVRRRRWAARQVSPEVSPDQWSVRAATRHGTPWARVNGSSFHPVGAEEVVRRAPPEACRRVVVAADQILAGQWQLLGAMRRDMVDPDWFFDPITGSRAPQVDYCFKVNHRSEEVTGNVKQVWELSRLHHLTVLATAFCISRDDRYAERARSHLRSWWAQNPFLSGVHWTSGIEAGIRLISWVWVRRLLEGWAGASELFEHNETARAQVWWHQRYLAAFRSRGSSANNHVIAEAAGLLISALAFDWFDESAQWSAHAGEVLEQELVSNTFPSGMNREMASEYHGFVTELAVVAAAEANWASRPVSDDLWSMLYRMFDVVAATVDTKVRGPRQGDGDGGSVLVLDPPPAQGWSGLLAIGESAFESPGWWPKVTPTVTSTLLATMLGHRPAARSERRESHYADSGLTILRSIPSDGDEIWCRCDAGPHGFLSIAAHAHADALAVEVRHDGIDVLADPGTYCYHGEPGWRSYFRSTLAHNTIEVDGRDQSTSGGAFLWTRHAQSHLDDLESDPHGDVVAWSAQHDGYLTLTPPLSHRRAVRLASHDRRIEIVDSLETAGRHSIRLAFHLGPEVDARLVGHAVHLTWSAGPATRTAMLLLPEGLSWSLSRGATEPILGWYSASFGEKVPAWAVVGEGECSEAEVDHFRTVLQFHC
jgi:Heparinase II/III-like protein/Heparinase II/III N-terminus